jgi:cystathionine beta-lyase family protein involved in aluminum resistance
MHQLDEDEKRSKREAEGEMEVGVKTGARREERKMMEIVQLSCLYGYKSRGRNTLERVYEEEKRRSTSDKQ